jgi:hypothetical protein
LNGAGIKNELRNFIWFECSQTQDVQKIESNNNSKMDVNKGFTDKSTFG